MYAKLIVNPYANRGKAGKQLPLIEEALRRHRLDYRLAVTTRPKEGAEEARKAKGEGFACVIAAGGDGTLHEVVNGLMLGAGEGASLPLGVLPIGTGNDMSDMVGLSRNLEESVARIGRSTPRLLDLGHVSWPENPQGYFFHNNCALAMEAATSIHANKLTTLSGKLRYLVATVQALRELRAWRMNLLWDDGELHGIPTYLLSVCNGPRAGSTFMLAPQAQFDDGLFDVVTIPEMRWRRVAVILPQLFNGGHLQQPETRYFRTRELRVTSLPTTAIHADGEILAESLTELHYTLHPQKLSLFF